MVRGENDNSGGLSVVVDGVIYSKQTLGGISRLYNEVLPRMVELDPSLQLLLVTEGGVKQTLPEHPRITHRAVPLLADNLRPRSFWRPRLRSIQSLVRERFIGDRRQSIWISTYYTVPDRWQGPNIVTVPDMIHERFFDLFNRPQDTSFRDQKQTAIVQADAVVCISKATRDDLKQIYGYPDRSLWVVPLACSDVFKLMEGDAPQSSKSEPFILYVGQRYHYKNFSTLLHAYSRWHAKYHVRLLVVGPPWSAGEFQLVAQLGLNSRVQLRSDVDDGQLRLLYNQASAFVYPSLYEGFGIPLLEAMACGCPIVASDIPSTREVAAEVPVYFDPINPESLTIALDRVISEDRNSIRTQQGLRRAKEYSWARTAQGFLEVCHNLN